MQPHFVYLFDKPHRYVTLLSQCLISLVVLTVFGVVPGVFGKVFGVTLVARLALSCFFIAS